MLSLAPRHIWSVPYWEPMNGGKIPTYLPTCTLTHTRKVLEKEVRTCPLSTYTYTTADTCPALPSVSQDAFGDTVS